VNGLGIAAKEFQQADKCHHPKEEWQSKRIIEMHGGKIWVEFG